jgi:hypothetical protein
MHKESLHQYCLHAADSILKLLKQVVEGMFTPRAHAWLGGLECILPPEQSTHFRPALTSSFYTSVEGIVDADEQHILRLLQFDSAKAGAKVAIRSKFAELKVGVCLCDSPKLTMMMIVIIMMTMMMWSCCEICMVCPNVSTD